MDLNQRHIRILALCGFVAMSASIGFSTLRAEVRESELGRDRAITRVKHTPRKRVELRELPTTASTSKRAGKTVLGRDKAISRSKWIQRRAQDKQLPTGQATEKRETKQWVDNRASIEKETWVRRIPTRNKHSRYSEKTATQKRETVFGETLPVKREKYENKRWHKAATFAKQRAVRDTIESRKTRNGRNEKGSIEYEKHQSRLREGSTLFENVDNDTRLSKRGTERVLSFERRMAKRRYERRKAQRAAQSSSAAICSICKYEPETK